MIDINTMIRSNNAGSADKTSSTQNTPKLFDQEQKLTKHDQAINRANQLIETMDKKLTKHDQQINQTKQFVEKLQQDSRSNIIHVDSKSSSHYDQKIAQHDQKISQHDQKISQHDQKIFQHEQKITQNIIAIENNPLNQRQRSDVSVIVTNELNRNNWNEYLLKMMNNISIEEKIKELARKIVPQFADDWMKNSFRPVIESKAENAADRYMRLNFERYFNQAVKKD
jgi:hypothetical protein